MLLIKSSQIAGSRKARSHNNYRLSAPRLQSQKPVMGGLFPKKNAVVENFVLCGTRAI